MNLYAGDFLKFHTYINAWTEIGRWDDDGYLAVYGGTNTGAAGGGRLIVGNSSSVTSSAGARISIDHNKITAYSSGSTEGTLYLNAYGGNIQYGTLGDNAYHYWIATTGTNRAAIDIHGNLYARNGTVASPSSDARLKTDVSDLAEGLE